MRRLIKKIAVCIDAKDILDRIPEEEKKGCSGLLIGNVDTKFFEFIFERMRYDLRIIQAALYKPHKDQDIYDMLQELIDKL